MTTFSCMEKPKRLQHPTSIRLAPAQVEAVREIAQREQRSIGGALRVLVSEAIAARSRRTRRAA